MVTAEAAIAAATLVTIMVLLAAVFAVLAAQLRVNDAARVAARSAAMGEIDPAGVARRSAPDAAIAVDRDGSVVVATATQRVSLPLPGLAALEVRGRAEVIDESSVFGWLG